MRCERLRVIAEITESLARAGVDLRQRPDGEWEVSVVRNGT
jgi:hypothetical protein